MEYMKGLPDKYFDIAIVDPQYGIEADKKNAHSSIRDNDDWALKEWDKNPPPKEYFIELMRVSKNQIIWGGNYFLDYLPSTQCFLIWNKPERNFSLADAEIAWTSFKKSIRVYDSPRNRGKRIHPTQKPIGLYKWIFEKFVEPGWKVLDTHLGSGSSAIVAEKMGFEFVGCEIDTDYFLKAKERFEKETDWGMFKISTSAQ